MLPRKQMVCCTTWSRNALRLLRPFARTIVIRAYIKYERSVTAAEALEKQIERYRSMSGEERLAIALRLHELACNVAREAIRQANPDADSAEVDRLLRRRLELARAG